MTDLSSETLHASTVAIDGKAVLISGRSGSGKSDLALRLIDRGAMLVSDDYTVVSRTGAGLLASAPENIRGVIEVRGVGLVTMADAGSTPVALIVEIEAPVPRLPDLDERQVIAGIKVPVLSLAPFEISTPIKVELALKALSA